MSASDFGVGNTRRLPASPGTGSAKLTWVNPDVPTPTSTAGGRTVATNALVVILLTMACTGLAVFDLVLLAGSY